MPSSNAPLAPLPPVMLTPFCGASLGEGLAAMGAPTPSSTVLGTGNVSLAYGLRLDAPVLLQKAFVLNGATVNGNFDIGLYSVDLRKLVSTGTTAQAGASILQEVDITDTWIAPGSYYLAFAWSSATATYFTSSISLVGYTGGASLQLTAFPLPATFVSGGSTSAFVFFGFACRTLAV